MAFAKVGSYWRFLVARHGAWCAVSSAFAKGVTQALPEAQISYDRFHVVAMANEAMDEVRREETRTQPQSIKAALGDNDRKLLKSLAWGMRRNPDGWSTKQLNAMHWLQHSTLKSARAWRLKMRTCGS